MYKTAEQEEYTAITKYTGSKEHSQRPREAFPDIEDNKGKSMMESLTFYQFFGFHAVIPFSSLKA